MKYILWDFDETLAYREGKWSQTLLELLEDELAMTMKIEEIRQHLMTGFPWQHHEKHQVELFGDKSFWDYMQQFFFDIFKLLGLSPDLALKLSFKVKNQYLKIEKWHLYDDVIIALEKLKIKGYQHIIVSNHVPELPELVAQLKLHNYFIKIISSGNVGYNKPHPKLFHFALENLPHYEKAIMIGDSYSADVMGASNIGLQCILVRSENTKGHLHYQKNLKKISEYVDAIL